MFEGLYVICRSIITLQYCSAVRPEVPRRILKSFRLLGNCTNSGRPSEPKGGAKTLSEL
jgi:hypothetical protein